MKKQKGTVPGWVLSKKTEVWLRVALWAGVVVAFSLVFGTWAWNAVSLVQKKDAFVEAQSGATVECAGAVEARADAERLLVVVEGVELKGSELSDLQAALARTPAVVPDVAPTWSEYESATENMAEVGASCREYAQTVSTLSGQVQEAALKALGDQIEAAKREAREAGEDAVLEAGITVDLVTDDGLRVAAEKAGNEILDLLKVQHPAFTDVTAARAELARWVDLKDKAVAARDALRADSEAFKAAKAEADQAALSAQTTDSAGWSEDWGSSQTWTSTGGSSGGGSWQAPAPAPSPAPSTGGGGGPSGGGWVVEDSWDDYCGGGNSQGQTWDGC